MGARNADPMCSFGDFVAISHEVDLSTALLLKMEVTEGIIAPGFSPDALETLTAKKGGKFVILQADPSFQVPDMEYRSFGGAGFMQKRNTAVFGRRHLKNVVTDLKEFSESAKLDLILASIAIKYTPSNSVGCAKDGMMIGIGAGQQSRKDWVNARVRFIEGHMAPAERAVWKQNFDVVPAALLEEEKASFLQTLDGVAISSDAFFMFRDCIDHAATLGVRFVAQPGGSDADEEVIGACNAYGMTMAFTGLRLFHH